MTSIFASCTDLVHDVCLLLETSAKTPPSANEKQQTSVMSSNSTLSIPKTVTIPRGTPSMRTKVMTFNPVLLGLLSEKNCTFAMPCWSTDTSGASTALSSGVDSVTPDHGIMIGWGGPVSSTSSSMHLEEASCV